LVIPRSILFVESDPAARESLTACLAALGPAFSGRVLASGADGLEELARGKFDAVAPTFQLSDMTGMEFLKRASELSPEVVGLLQIPNDERPALLKHASLPPQFLPHPPNVKELQEGLVRAFQLMRWMEGKSIRTLLGRMENLPAVPSLYARVMRELRSEDPSIETVGKLIAQDPALTAKMLQMVNSPVFALGRPICEAVDAVTFLGAERTKALILMASLSLHGSLTPCEGFSQESFWQHSLTVATMGRLLALKELKNAGLADACFTAGLLHDIGKLLFASNLPREYSAVVERSALEGLSLHQAEIEEFGVSHGQLAASLLGMWGLPIPVLEAIAWHEHPIVGDVPGFSAVTVVHAANVLEHEKRGGEETSRTPHFEVEYLEALGLKDRLNHWRSLCGCPARHDNPAGATSPAAACVTARAA
jgi:HD-like signal output (HDOD) protein/CheY-like chemotaxis protein